MTPFPIARRFPLVRFVFILLLCLACGAAVSHAGGAPVPWSVSIIGPSGTTGGAVNAINNQGQSVGYVSGADRVLHPFFHSPATGLVDLGGIPAGPRWEGVASTINEAGEVVGHYYDGSGVSRPFYWSAATGRIDVGASGSSIVLGPLNNLGTGGAGIRQSSGDYRSSYTWSLADGFIDLAPVLGEGAAVSQVNDRGQITGTVPYGSTYLTRAFRYTPGRAVELLPAPSATSPYGGFVINRRGDVLGQESVPQPYGYVNKVVFWPAEGGVRELAPPSALDCFSGGLNDRGEVALSCESLEGNGADVWKGYYWSAGTGFIEVGDLGRPWLFADAINANGHIVGYALTSSPLYEFHPYAWSRETGIVDLGGPVGDGSYGRAWAINDLDQAAGFHDDPALSYLGPAVWSVSLPLSPPPPPPPGPGPGTGDCSLEALIVKVNGFVASGVLGKGQGNSLAAKLRAAINLRGKPKGGRTSGSLGAFVNEVEALARTRRLGSAVAGELIACAESLDGGLCPRKGPSKAAFR
jgi:probable HAF family extracellular repeat protein